MRVRLKTTLVVGATLASTSTAVTATEQVNVGLYVSWPGYAMLALAQ